MSVSRVSVEMKWAANPGLLRDSYLINTGPVPSPASSLPSSPAFSEMGKSGIQFRYLHPPFKDEMFPVAGEL